MLEYRRDCRALCAAGESAELRAHQDCSATPLHALQIQIFTVHVVTSAFFTRAPSGGKKNPRWFGSAVVSSSFTNRDRTPAENRRTAASATRGGSQAWRRRAASASSFAAKRCDTRASSCRRSQPWRASSRCSASTSTVDLCCRRRFH